ncbi:MAG: hypothetical protein HYV19_03430 [Gemmatimonadetes bacterium]|nr:hypothetical protein [Gemmatimonadota bacterium]
MLNRLGLRPHLRSADFSRLRQRIEVWEEVGNHVYAISERDFETVVLGMGYPACAFKGLKGHYKAGVAFEPATSESALFRRVQAAIAAADQRCRRDARSLNHGMLVAVILKRPLTPRATELLRAASYFVKPTPSNRYEQRKAPAANSQNAPST